MKTVSKLREKQKANTHRLILKSARYLFEKEGYEKTTIRKIATHAEIGLGTIYKHFSQKSTVLAAVFCDDIGEVMEKAYASVPKDSHIKEQLIAMAAPLYRFYERNAKLSKTYFKRMYFIEGEGKRATDQLDQRCFEILTDLFNQAKERNEIRNEFDHRVAGQAFFSQYLSCLMFHFFKEEFFSAEKTLKSLKQMVDVILYGMAVKLS